MLHTRFWRQTSYLRHGCARAGGRRVGMVSALPAKLERAWRQKRLAASPDSQKCQMTPPAPLVRLPVVPFFGLPAPVPMVVAGGCHARRGLQSADAGGF